MQEKQTADPLIISIEGLLSARKIRSLNPNEPIDILRISSPRFFDMNLATEVSKWKSIRNIGIWTTTTKAALRQLLTVSGWEEAYVLHLHQHGSIKGASIPKALHTFRCGELVSDDLMCIAEWPSLTTLGAQNSALTIAVVEKFVSTGNLTHLDVEASNLDDEMAALLATSKTITHLDMGATRVGPAGLQSICSMTQLRELDIWALDIQVDDLDMLTELPNLEYLSVGGHDEQTVLTAKRVLPKIARLPKLNRIFLDGIPCTKDEITELEHRYDNVQVMFDDHDE